LEDSRITYIDNTQNEGIVISRNKALMASQGDYIAVLDSDDIALPTRMEKQLDYLISHPEIYLCGSYITVINETDDILAKKRYPLSPSAVKNSMLFGNCFLHSSVLYRNLRSQQFHYDRECPYCEDYELFYRMNKAHEMVNLPEYYTLYRIHSHNVSSQRDDKMRFHLRNIHKGILKDHALSFSEDELDLHLHFLNANAHYFRTPENQERLMAWLDRLSFTLMNTAGLSEQLIKFNILQRWMMICVRNGDYPLFLKSGLLKKNKNLFWDVIRERIIDKVNHLNWENRN
jgi:glycosyltransferase involved in cell wall biosynthesis